MANAKKLPSGSWRIRVFIGEDENGKKRTKSFTAPTRWQCEREAEEFLKCLSEEKQKVTIGQAIDDYIKAKENVISPSTIRGYNIIRRTRLQSLMDVDVSELDSYKMQMAINIDAPNLSRKSISEAKNLVLTALRMYGIRPDINVTLPAKKPKIKELPPAERIADIVIGTDIELPCLLAMWLSLRMSEVRGLQFQDIKDGVITVQRARMYLDGKEVLREVNKTVTSTRQLTLPQYIKDMIEKIPHKEETDFIVNKGYSFIKKHFDALMKENGIDMTFHDLRHINASVMLMLGVPDKYAMERGGWSTTSTLKSVYQHTFSDERKQVDETIDEFFNSIVLKNADSGRGDNS